MSYRVLKLLNILIFLGIIVCFLNIVSLTVFYFTDLSEYGLNLKIKIGAIEVFGNELDFTFDILVMVIINSLLVLCLLFFALTIIKNLIKKQIFIEKNYKIIRNTSYILAIMSIFSNIPQNLVINEILEKQKVLSENINSSLSINYGFLIVAVTLFVFSFIFKEGIRIAEENKFTV